MNKTKLHLEWTRPATPWTQQFTTGVSLHSHTLHSRESLGFIYTAAKHSALLRYVLRKSEARFQTFHPAQQLNLEEGWWTPPLTALAAMQVEEGQIADLNLRPLVSLTDHDNIEAPLALLSVRGAQEVPISLEWTVPFRGTFFHLGVHNIKPSRAKTLTEEMFRLTAHLEESRLNEILSLLAANRQTLVILNHPLWDEAAIGADLHRRTVSEFLGLYRQYLHALELNGLRPWRENKQVIALAEAWNVPAISGGDRHALEPNAILNLTNAETFPEFVSEVRYGHSDVLFMSHYRVSQPLRIFHNMTDVFRPCPEHGLGWTQWTDRVFYAPGGREPQSLSQLWNGRVPAFVNIFANTMLLAGQSHVRGALRSASLHGEQVLP